MPRFWFGLLCLLFAALNAFVAVGFGLSSVIHDSPAANPVIPIVLSIVALCAAFALWMSQLRATPGDDLFSGKRGMLVAMMFITSGLVFAFTVLALINRDAWRGFFEGLRG